MEVPPTSTTPIGEKFKLMEGYPHALKKKEKKPFWCLFSLKYGPLTKEWVANNINMENSNSSSYLVAFFVDILTDCLLCNDE